MLERNSSETLLGVKHLLNLLTDLKREPELGGIGQKLEDMWDSEEEAGEDEEDKGHAEDEVVPDFERTREIYETHRVREPECEEGPEAVLNSRKVNLLEKFEVEGIQETVDPNDEPSHNLRITYEKNNEQN